MDLVWGHSSLGLFKFNIKWQYIPTTWGAVELVNLGTGTALCLIMEVAIEMTMCGT